jgi:hypothetical protein
VAAVVKPLPQATTPQAFAAWLNKNFNGGKPIAGGLNLAGSTVGDQWLAFYSKEHGQLGSKFTLQEYETAFVADATTALLNTDLQAGITGGASDVGTITKGTEAGVLNLYQSGILGFLGRLSDGNLWLRVGEGVLGIVLIAIGVAKLTNAVPVATKIAAKIG